MSFINKIKNLKNILEDAVLVTADVGGIYPVFHTSLVERPLGKL